ncbi:Uncharacterised protein [Vibrio cholerae]|nr:Uncharacterised protein [Vibrio cholerae]
MTGSPTLSFPASLFVSTKRNPLASGGAIGGKSMTLKWS